MDSIRPLARWIAKAPRPRFTIRAWIRTIAIAAVSSALLTSLWREEPSPVGGLVLVVGSIAAVATIRVVTLLRRDRQGGRTTSVARGGRFIVGSVGVAMLIVLVADLAFFEVYWPLFLWKARFPRHGRFKDYDGPAYTVEALVLGFAAALLVASRLREAFWLPVGESKKDRRWWVRLWPVAVVAAVVAWRVGVRWLGLDVMRT